MEEDREGTKRFFELIKNKYGRKLHFSAQTRLDTAKDQEFLTLLRDVNVRRVYIGYESPIDEDLQAMKKGYSSADMLEWTKVYHSFGFFVHAMFIFGYPGHKAGSLSAEERMNELKKFIHTAKLDSIQVLKPIPLPGTALRERLAKSGQLLPLEIIPWEMYDGNHVCFTPHDMSLRELQECPTKIMGWFYRSRSLFWIGLRTLIMPIDYLLRGWQAWYRDWWNDVRRFGGSRVYKKWKRRNNEALFLKRVEEWLKNR
jgi:radical SAM superfamily enzyme YgiQ (UPF0313 family)